MNASIWMDGIRNFFSLLDRVIYFLIEWTYELLMKLAELQIFQEGQITEFATRVYSLLGLFMLFKVSFSLINFLVNPDSLTEGKAGGSQVVKRVILTLILIIIVPLGFDLVYRAQTAILKDQILPQFILGTKDDGLSEQTLKIDPTACDDVTVTENGGAFIALVTFKPFYQLYSYDDGQGIKKGFSDPRVLDGYCHAQSVQDLLHPVYHQSEIDKDWIIANTGSYVVDYQMLWSTIVGVVVLLLMISFCFDAAVRTIKLGFLEIIAPIPIISYVDPKTSNNGPFNKWLKEVGRTWASLFIRLAAVFFAVYIIRMVNENYNNNVYGEDAWLMLFLIIGALMFAKKLPGLIESILGIKLDGNLQLNPLKKIANEALGGKAILGVGAGALVATVSGGGNFVTRAFDRKTWQNGIIRGTGRMFGSAIAGAASSGVRTFSKVSKDGRVFAGAKAGHLEAMFAKQQREDLNRKGSKMGGRIKADLARAFGVMNAAQRNTLEFAQKEQEIKGLEQHLKDIETLIKENKDKASSGYQEYADILNKMSNKVDNQKNVKEAAAAIQAAKDTGKYFDAEGNKTELANILDEKEKAAKRQAYQNVQSSVDMQEWRKRLKYLVENESNLAGYNSTGLAEDGTIDKKSMYRAKDSIQAVETTFAQQTIELEERKRQITEQKTALERAKEDVTVLAAEADNAARRISGPQPEGWKPSPDVNSGSTSGYGPNQYYSGGRDGNHHR